MSDLVFGAGPKDSHIAIVAEAPAHEELRLGEPLVGETGKLNDRLMGTAKILRSDVYLTNVWKEEIPARSKTKKFPYDLIKTEKWKRYRELLSVELAELPNLTVIAALGELAFHTLTGEISVTKRRGGIYPCILSDVNVKVLGMRHPSAALPYRNFCLQYVMVRDYKILLSESKFPDIRLPQREILINPTFDEAITYLREIQGPTVINCDIESPRSVGEITHISFAKSPWISMSIPFKIGSKNNYHLDEELELWDEIARIAEDPTIVVGGHNFSFDATYMYRKYGIRWNSLRDSMQAQGIVYAALPSIMKPKGLAFTASIHTRENYYKDDGKEFNVTGIGSEDQYQIYNAKDSAVSYESEEALVKELKEQGNYEEYLRTCRLIEPLVYMGEHGIKLDLPNLKKTHEEAQEKISELKEQMFSEAGYEFNPGSVKDLKELFYIKRGHKPYTNKGKISCDVNAMKRLSGKGDVLAKIILDYRYYSKRDSTYYTTKPSEDGRFKCAYNPYLETSTKVVKSGGTKQGRLSSGQNIFGEGTNAQNLPEEMLRLLIADDGYVTYDIDLEQAENRIVAYVAPDKEMIEAFENNVDIHRKTAMPIFGYTNLEDVTDKPACSICIKAGQESMCGHKGDRFWGKKSNHSLNYDEGPELYALINEIPLAEAKRQISAYFDLYPGVKAMHEWIRNQLYRIKSLTNPFGRKFVFMDLVEKSLKQAYSYIPQTTVAGIINWWGILNIWDTMPEVDLQAQVHDSIRFQIPIAVGWQRHAEILLQVKRWLEQPVEFRGRSFSIPINCKMGLNFADMEKIELNVEKHNVVKNLEKAYEGLSRIC